MTAGAVIQIIGWGTRALQAVIEVISEAARAAEPPSLEELRVKVQGAIDAHHEDWISAARAEADKALVEAAAREFSDEIKHI